MRTEIPVTETTSGNCQCGCTSTDTPVLDARELPHAIRHGAIFGALSTLKPGASMVLIAPHDPIPLLKQLADQPFGDQIEYTYGDRAPEAVRVRFTRKTASAQA